MSASRYTFTIVDENTTGTIFTNVGTSNYYVNLLLLN